MNPNAIRQLERFERFAVNCCEIEICMFRGLCLPKTYRRSACECIELQDVGWMDVIYLGLDWKALDWIGQPAILQSKSHRLQKSSRFRYMQALLPQHIQYCAV